jgi:hypothetical protein
MLKKKFSRLGEFYQFIPYWGEGTVGIFYQFIPYWGEGTVGIVLVVLCTRRFQRTLNFGRVFPMRTKIFDCTGVVNVELMLTRG